MKSYKEMNWEELEDCADKIREEIDRFETDAALWESREANFPTPDFHSRLEELRQESGYIQSLQEVLE
jgi:hypothetical protein